MINSDNFSGLGRIILTDKCSKTCQTEHNEIYNKVWNSYNEVNKGIGKENSQKAQVLFFCCFYFWPEEGPMYLKALWLLGWGVGFGFLWVFFCWLVGLVFCFSPTVIQFGLIICTNPKLCFTYHSWRGWLEEQTEWHLASTTCEISYRVGKIPGTT